MASFAALRSTASRRLLVPAVRNTQRRHLALGGHSGPPPEWTGIDKIVRSYVPHDYQRTFSSKRYICAQTKFQIPSLKQGEAPLDEGILPFAIAILGGYTGLYVLYSISSMIGGKKKAPEPAKAAAPAAASSSSSEGVPDVESPEFVTFLESDALVKLLESEESLKTLTE
eukprot:scaffold1982_cov93-Amphora_coffeaeformis.AAC.14